MHDVARDEARAVMYGLAGQKHPEEWSPTETLFAFMAWMTVRHHEDDIGDSALMVHRIRQFCELHDLRVLRNGWEQAIVPDDGSVQTFAAGYALARADVVEINRAYARWMTDRSKLRPPKIDQAGRHVDAPVD